MTFAQLARKYGAPAVVVGIMIHPVTCVRAFVRGFLDALSGRPPATLEDEVRSWPV